MCRWSLEVDAFTQEDEKRKKFSTESWGMIFTGLREGKPTRDEEVLVCWAKGKTGVIMSQNHRGEE